LFDQISIRHLTSSLQVETIHIETTNTAIIHCDTAWFVGPLGWIAFLTTSESLHRSVLDLSMIAMFIYVHKVQNAPGSETNAPIKPDEKNKPLLYVCVISDLGGPSVYLY